MNFTDTFQPLLPYLAFLGFVLLGEIQRDNLYRTIAGFIALGMTVYDTTLPTSLRGAWFFAFLYLSILVWFFQLEPRHGAMKNSVFAKIVKYFKD